MGGSIVQDVVEFLDTFVGILAAGKAGIDILDPFDAPAQLTP
ncbi:MAG: hypothetical protein ABI171_00685 [Collimonas sp.]